MITAKPHPYEPNTAAYNALYAVHRYGMVTARHIQRRYYSENSLRYAQRALTTLREHGFVLQREVSAKGRVGSGPYCYYLAEKGRSYLRKLGIHSPAPKRSAGLLQRIKASSFVHPEAVTDFLITADLAAEQYPDNLRITLLQHEKQLVRILGNRQPIPDALCVFDVFDGHEWYTVPVAVEIDNGTEGVNYFSPEKVAAYLAWDDTGYLTEFAPPDLTIAVVALSGIRRQRDLRVWTETKLTQLGKTQCFHRFRFTDLHPATTDPYDLFFERVWVMPFAPEPVTLFTQVTGTL